MSVYVGQECACNVCARWESTCIRQEEPTCRAPVRQEHARIVWVLVQAVPACKRGTATCMQGVSADLKCTPQSTNVCEGQTAVCRREDAGRQTPMPPLLLCDLLSL